MILKIEMLDDEGKAMHAMIALYWKADGSHRSSTTEKSFQMKQVILDGDIKLIFVKYANSILLSSFNLSSIHAELNDENLVRMIFFMKYQSKIIWYFS